MLDALSEYQQQLDQLCYKAQRQAKELQETLDMIGGMAPRCRFVIRIEKPTGKELLRKVSQEIAGEAAKQVAEADEDIERANAVEAQRQENARLKAEAATEIAMYESRGHIGNHAANDLAWTNGKPWFANNPKA